MLVAEEIEVGVRGRNITVRGVRVPDAKNTYERTEEISLELTLARELFRLLSAAIPLAETFGPIRSDGDVISALHEVVNPAVKVA
jgi:hypothetical protein